MTKYDLKELLEYIDPSSLSYQEWCNVGMALKHEGYSAEEWDSCVKPQTLPIIKSNKTAK